MAFQRFEWWPCGYPKGSQRISFSRVSEGTLGTFWARFWGVLGTKLGGVSAFRVVAMSRAESDRTRQDGYPKGRQKFFFSRVSEGTLGTFWARFWSVLGTKLGGVSAFRVVAMWLSQRQAKVLFFFSGFRRDVRHFLGSIFEHFGHEIRWRFSVSSGGHEQQQQQQEQQEGSMSHCTNSGIK